MAPDALIVIPTYNESENVGELLEGIRAHLPQADVLVVDDASPDGTAAQVEALAPRLGGRVEVLRRAGRFGIGSAYVEGFRRGLGQGYRLLFTMDADLSHEPRFLPALYAAAADADLVIGSRYLHGVSVLNWSLRRLAMSVFANAYARRITGLPVRDCTSGFQCVRRAVLEAIAVDRLRFGGYSFLIELKYRAFRHGFRLLETPIVFTDRKLGQSKITRHEVLRSVWAVWAMRLRPAPRAPRPAG
jgi:dolichol-phosphate mannosyltransferase